MWECKLGLKHITLESWIHYVYVTDNDITNFTSVSNPWLWFSYNAAINSHFWILAQEKFFIKQLEHNKYKMS